MTHENGYDSEKTFFDKISKHINIMFDVGTYTESIYTQFDGIVHYFDPYEPYIDTLKNQPNNNKESFFNSIGLSDAEGSINFYPNTSSLVKRPCSSDGFVSAFVKRGDTYIEENNVDEIDFLKIDVECMESYVFRGFAEKLNNVKIIQFEYGPGQAEVGDNLNNMLTYLEQYGFKKFYFMFHGNPDLIEITNRNDTWNWCNIVSYNSKYFDTEPWN